MKKVKIYCENVTVTGNAKWLEGTLEGKASLVTGLFKTSATIAMDIINDVSVEASALKPVTKAKNYLLVMNKSGIDKLVRAVYEDDKVGNYRRVSKTNRNHLLKQGHKLSIHVKHLHPILKEGLQNNIVALNTVNKKYPAPHLVFIAENGVKSIKLTTPKLKG